MWVSHEVKERKRENFIFSSLTILLSHNLLMAIVVLIVVQADFWVLDLELMSSESKTITHGNKDHCGEMCS